MSQAVKPKKIPAYTLMAGEVYDLIYANKDYQGQAARLHKIITERCESGGKDVLEAACGTGKYMEFLNGNYNIDGFDISAGQVRTAQKRLPKARIIQADMLDFDMGKQYDAVLCLFSSIGYLKTKASLDRAIANFARHTKPSGVVVVEPWLRAEDLIPGHISLEANSNGHLSVARMSKLTRHGSVTSLELHHMLGTADGIEHFLEVHEMALYTDKEFQDAFTKAGLQIHIDPQGLTGRRLCIGRKPLKKSCG